MTDDKLKRLREWAKEQRDAAAEDFKKPEMWSAERGALNAERIAYERVMGMADRLLAEAEPVVDAPQEPLEPDEREKAIEEWRKDSEELMTMRLCYRRPGEDVRLPEWCYGMLGRAVALMRSAPAPKPVTDDDIKWAINELCEAAYAFAESDSRVDIEQCPHAALEREKQRALEALIARKVAQAAESAPLPSITPSPLDTASTVPPDLKPSDFTGITPRYSPVDPPEEPAIVERAWQMHNSEGYDDGARTSALLCVVVEAIAALEAAVREVRK